jgi:hypothetical protein
MNSQETEKFNKILADGYNELINLRPEKPLEHFIYHLLDNIPRDLVEKDKKLLSFYQNFKSKTAPENPE